MATISDGTNSITPLLVTRYEAAQESRNIFHDVIGRADPDVTLRPASTRRGSLELLFENGDDAETARALLAQPKAFTYTDPDLPTAGMRFALDGNLSPALEDETRELWQVTVSYRELAP